MSDRTWLGTGRKNWADYNLCDYPSMGELCQAACWKLPAKVFSPTRERMAEFLEVMDDQHCMAFDDFWELEIGEEGNWEDYANTPTRASIDVMEMFGDFLKAAGETETEGP